jgi:hypothetical protein
MTTTSMSSLITLLALAVPAIGCTSELEVGSGAAGLGGVDVYEKQFAWTEPEACQTYLHRRVYDEDARVVSYEATALDRELTATYLVDEAAALPLGIEISDHQGTLVTLRASAENLEVRDAHGELALKVLGYAEGPDETIERTQRPVDAASFALLSCTLPMRTELGRVPWFVRNVRDAITPNSAGVGGSSAEATPLVPWNSPVSLLGAWVRQGLCLRTCADGLVDWKCACFEVRDPIVGIVRGDCS